MILQEFNKERLKDGNPIILYGAAMYGELAFNALRALNMPVYAFCDRVQAGQRFCGLAVLPPEELKQYPDAHVLVCATKGLEGITNYLESISHRRSYEISGLLPCVEYEKLPPYCCALPIEKLIEKYRFYLPGSKAKDKSLALSFVAMSITERCSLRCRKCSVLAPHYPRPADDPYDTVIPPFGRFLNCVDSIAELQVGGGEPFMHKQLGAILAWCVKQEKIREISIFTNSTILPDETLAGILSDPKIKLLLDDYGTLSRKLPELIELCNRRNIRYIIQKFEHWDDLGDFSKKEESEEKLTRKFQYCSFGNVNSFMKGKLYRCTTAARIADLGIVLEEPGDYVDFTQEKPLDEWRHEIFQLLHCKDYHAGCMYCNGISTHKIGIPVAEQLEAHRK